MKKYISSTALAFVLMTLMPPLALSAGNVAVRDTVAGVGATIECAGFPPSARLDFTLTPPLGGTENLEATTDEKGKASIRVSGEATQFAGTYAVELTGDMQDPNVQTTFTVFPDTVSERESSIEATRTSLSPDGEDAVQVAVLLRDQYLNPLANRPVELVSSRKDDRIVAEGGETDDGGQQVFRVSTTEPGSFGVRAIDLLSGKVLDAELTLSAGEEAPRGGTYDEESDGTSRAVPVGEYNGKALYAQLTDTSDFDVIDHFRLVIDGTAKMENVQVPIRQDTSFRVIAEDRQGQTVEDYVGVIRFSSTDPKAILPFGDRKFAAKDLGVKTFTLGLRFNTGGEQTIAVEDATGKVEGTLTVEVSGGGSSTEKHSLSITDPREGSVIGSPSVTVKGTGPALINLIVTGGSEIARGDTDADGLFQIPVRLSTVGTGATLQVQEATGKYSSGELHIRIDVTAPKITTVAFLPSQPAEGQPVKVAVKSDPRLPSVTVKIDTETITLAEGTASGTYVGTFTAPKPGKYQPLATAADTFGNKSEMLTELVVKDKTPAKVKGVEAEGKVNSVELKWTELPGEEADSYRIYVGETANDFSYTLDTDKAVPTAIVAGLKPATKYYFAVTALKNKTESAEKSDIVEATVLGLTLTVIAEDSSLLLEWAPVKSVPLSAYALEYGVEKGSLTEKRMVNSEAESFALRDLLNGVKYFVRLTPITSTGEMMKELAATGEGTPNGSGFHNAAPGGRYTPRETTPPPTVTPPPTTVVKPGLPETILLGSALIGAGVFLLFHVSRRRTLSMTSAFLEEMDRQYRK